jgi:hypothetical protein
MGYLLDSVNAWKQFAKTHGELEEISVEEAKQLDEHYVWTLWSRGSDFLANEFVISGEAISYFKTTNKWVAERGSLTFVMTEWVECPTCEENSEDDDWDPDECSECEGSGTLSISIPACLNCKSDEEILEMREA